jgi:hypothetical protein
MPALRRAACSTEIGSARRNGWTVIVPGADAASHRRTAQNWPCLTGATGWRPFWAGKSPCPNAASCVLMGRWEVTVAIRERLRENPEGTPVPEYLRQRAEAGWRLVAVEWEREAENEPSLTWAEDIPYGLRVSPDCSRLVQNPTETEIIVVALDMIVEDCPLSHVADELNRRGYRTRSADPWTPTALFNLLPRMIQVSPRLLASEEWRTRRQRLPRLA